MRTGGLERAMTSLEGLSVGDGFGEQFFLGVDEVDRIHRRQLPQAPWYYTDDTIMSIGIVGHLKRFGTVQQDELAMTFARNYMADPARGYGPAMHRTLSSIANGEHWKLVTQSAFDGMGSWGNGAAMRAAPLGAYFAEQPAEVVRQATLSAQVTHAHPEAIAGAVAVALAASVAARWRLQNTTPSFEGLIDQVLEMTPESDVSAKIRVARRLSTSASRDHAVATLGNGSKISAPDTVPFCIWGAAQHLTDFEAAMWFTVGALGDRDTTCAIVGGIVASYVGMEGITQAWRLAREELPNLI